ncbi:PAS-domain containing protein [Methylobacterium sp. 17Sr1-1]|uniref:PAS-domain containing protein n=1 Tax=Methylobacterium sp. 17Sr1-1 TaxID=2202826 RepID=UPI000D6EF4A0|nr:PAS-domain containing protein [Methylobacterium sp. 17Sr1-1]AWN52769.1 hybrid sensor histidine kinase/response regulator [Methylobacterium sp. 17Sr1-1]
MSDHEQCEAREAGPSGFRARLLRTHVAALAVALLVPALLIIGLIAHRWVQAEQARMEERTATLNAHAVEQIDRFLSGQIAMLQALATSPALEHEDFARFDRQARELVRLQGINIVLRDADGQQRVNTRLPWGAPLPRAVLDNDRVVRETGAPAISDLVAGTVTGQPIVVVTVPVRRDGALAYFLNATLPAPLFGGFLRGAGVSAPYSGSVADRNGIIIGRSVDTAAAAGKPLPGFRSVSGTTGQWWGRNLSGIPVFGTHHRSALSGWVVTIGIEQAALRAPFVTSVLVLAPVILGLSLIALIASLLVGRRILLAKALLARAADDLSRGVTLRMPVTPIREVNEVGAVLAQTSAILQRQADALRKSNADLEDRIAARTRELVAKEAVLTTTLDAMDQGLIMVDAQGRVAVTNRRLAELLDLDPAFLAARPSRAEMRRVLTAAGEYAGVDPAFEHAITVGDLAVIGERYERTRPNGTILEVHNAPTADGGVLRTLTDITARRKAEAALQRKKALLDATLANMDQGVLLIDTAGIVQLCNERAIDLLGLPPEYRHGHPTLAELVAWQSASGEFGDAAAERPPWLALTGDLLGAPPVYERTRPDGTVLEVRTVRLAEGGAIRTVSDVTERKRRELAVLEANRVAEAARVQAEAAQRQAEIAQRQAEIAQRQAEIAQRQAEAASAAKTEFLATMSHEIRTPLNGVIGYAELLVRAGDLSPVQGRSAARIQEAGQALLTVVNDVLDFSKIEAGQIDLDPQPFGPAALADGAVSIVRTAADAKRLALGVETAPDLAPRLVGDPDRLRQVLLNLVNNAIKFTPAGRVTLHLASAPLTCGRHALRVAVSDTGIGIPADRLGQLFQRFSQVDGSIRRRFGGTGLGLAISRQLVEAMGGTIGVESRPGAGSTFWFTVPLAAAAEDDPARERPPLAPLARPAKVLLVEDSPINQDIARAILERRGHAVSVAGDGAEAVSALQAGGYDVVLMDVQMPGMDGLTATRHIRALGSPASRLPIVALTANVLPQQVAQFRAAGMDDHVGKPFRPDELLATVERWSAPRTADAA